MAKSTVGRMKCPVANAPLLPLYWYTRVGHSTLLMRAVVAHGSNRASTRLAPTNENFLAISQLVVNI